MKIEAQGNQVVLKEVFAGITLETIAGKQLYVCEREGGFDVKFGNGKWMHIDDETDIVINQPKYNPKTVPFYG